LGQWAGAKELLLAVVHTDIADSVVIQQKLGVEKSRELRDSHIARARRLVGDSNNTGHYVNNTGDGVLCVFRSAASALDFALALESDPGDPQITIRCAIDTGLVAITNDDTVHGRPVNYAARIRDACRQSTIWISHAAKIEIDQQGAARHARLDWHRHRPQKFKGFKDSPVVWSLDNPANSSSATSTATDLESGQRRRDSSRTIQMP
jgi:class 3 adenylate cyclase